MDPVFRIKQVAKSIEYGSSINSTPDEKPQIVKDYGDGFLVRAMTPKDLYDYLENCKEEMVISLFDEEIWMTVTSFKKHLPSDLPSAIVGELNGEVISIGIFVPWSKHVVYAGCGHIKKGHRHADVFAKKFDYTLHQWGSRYNFVCADVSRLNRREIPGLPVTTVQGLTAKYEAFAQELQIDVMKDKKVQILKATDVNIENIMDFDSHCFVIKDSPLRKPFLEEWIRLPGASFVAVNDKNVVVGLGCRRSAINDRTHMVGPLYAVDDDIAHALLANLSSDVIGDRLILSVRLTHPYAVKFAEDHGFKVMVYYARKFWGKTYLWDYEQSKWNYSVTSLGCCGF